MTLLTDYLTKAVDVTESGGSYVLDLSQGTTFRANDTGEYTYTVSNIPNTSYVGRYEFSYNGGNITWPTEFKWKDGTAPSLVPAQDHLIEFSKIKNSTNLKAIHHGSYEYTGSVVFPTFVGSTGNGGINGVAYTISLTSLTGGSSSSVSANDVGILILVEETQTGVPDIPSGWTNVASFDPSDSYDARTRVCYRVMDGTETSVSIASNGDTTAAHCGLLFVFSGVDTSNPLDVAISGTETLNTAQPPAMPTLASSSEDVAKIAIGVMTVAHTYGYVNVPDATGLYEYFASESENDTGDVTIAMGFQKLKATSINVTPPLITWPMGDSTSYSNVAMSILLRGAS
jgi:hypothetical protein